MVRSFWRRPAFLLLLLALQQFTVHASIVISEFLASNNDGRLDEDGDAVDWIELHNTDATTPVDISGYHLTDDATEPTKWTFPSGLTMAPNSYLLVFASNKDRATAGSELHTNFKLGASGEYLGLYDTTTTTAAETTMPLFAYAPEFPAQEKDQSYGLDAFGNRVYFDQPTPGTVNSGSGKSKSNGVAEDVAFSAERGFYDAPLTLLLSTTQSSPYIIRYTLDGSEPSATVGVTYSNPITMTTTTVVRASVVASGFVSSPVATHTYIYSNDVIQQPMLIPKEGFPNGRLVASGPNTGEVPLDFAMDPTIVQQHAGAEIQHAMESAIPTMILSSSTDDMFGDDGFYYGEDVEKAISMEVLYTDGTSHQQDVGVEPHSHNRLKRALRLNFRSEYGIREWPTNIFQSFPVGGDTAENKVRRVILRSGNNRSWARAQPAQDPGAMTYTEDEFYRTTQQAMSGYSAHGTFVHLYLNGVYEGVYNLVERPDDTFGEIYFGGSDDDWYFVKHQFDNSPKDSPRWDYLTQTLIQKNMKNGDNYAELQQYLNVQDFADYMLLNFYTGMTDWPRKNWYALSREDTSPQGTAPLKFVAWDGELILDQRQSRPGKMGATIQRRFLWDTGFDRIIVRIWHSIRKSPDFRTLLAERAALHTADGGALAATVAMQRWDDINDFVRAAMIGESARWGDSLALLGGKFAATRTRNGDWEAYVTKIRTLLEGNTAQFLDEMALLDQCNDSGMLKGVNCFVMENFWSLVERFDFMSRFYR